jgi:hypothetical protein
MAYPTADALAFIDPSELARYAPLVALENLPGAADIYGFRLPDGDQPALVVGNERRGVARDVQTQAVAAVRIPMPSRSVDCLNVAAAAAVALYYIARGGGGRSRSNTRPEGRRPELLLLAPGNHVEAGSAIRSAAAFGWERLFLDDRRQAWFGVDRVRRAEGRAAARRARNRVRVTPFPGNDGLVFDEVCVVTMTGDAPPLSRANLARGKRQLLIIPDESVIDIGSEDWSRLGRRVTVARIDLPAGGMLRAPHFRVPVSIALAESARQIGAPGRLRPGVPPPRRPTYERAIDLRIADLPGVDFVGPDELAAY